MSSFVTPKVAVSIDGIPIAGVLKVDCYSRHSAIDDISNLDSPHSRVRSLIETTIEMDMIVDRNCPGQRAIRNSQARNASSKFETMYQHGGWIEGDVYVSDITLRMEPSGLETMKVTLLACGGIVIIDPNAPIPEIEDYDMSTRF